jgi:glycosyltransferase involved in cell wall biosynthesis
LGKTRVVACVPVWNAADFIVRTLDSLAAQTYEDLRILISVDLSDDATAEVCDRYAMHHSRFDVIHQTARLGWIGNVNHLLRQVDAPYAMFAFHDDILDPRYVERLARRLDENPNAVLAFSDMETTYQDGQKEVSQYDELDGVTDPVERTRRIIQKRGDWWTPHRGIFRAAVGKRIGGLRPHRAGEFGADWPWLLHLSLHGQFSREPEVLCFKYYRDGSLSRSWGFTTAQRGAVALSCLREVMRAKVPIALKLAAMREILVPCLLLIRPWLIPTPRWVRALCASRRTVDH